MMILAVAFLHSEFDFITPQNHSHATHDYCQLVNAGTNRMVRTPAPAIQKPTVVKHICFHCVNEHSARIQATLFLQIKYPLLNAPPSQDLSLDNCVFLI